ncbi:hypothetical protein [Nocardia sp. NPDC004860]|uniref:hypothetical protein n=1 Tax=Nocardia sp. NPDC004860 TaxID=3154557 RepID=UPI0033A8F54D
MTGITRVRNPFRWTERDYIALCERAISLMGGVQSRIRAGPTALCSDVGAGQGVATSA